MILNITHVVTYLSVVLVACLVTLQAGLVITFKTIELTADLAIKLVDSSGLGVRNSIEYRLHVDEIQTNRLLDTLVVFFCT